MEATITVFMGNVISVTFCINVNYAYHINVKVNYVPRLTEIKKLSRKNPAYSGTVDLKFTNRQLNSAYINIKYCILVFESLAGYSCLMILKVSGK